MLPKFSLTALGIESSSMVVSVRDLLAEKLKPVELVSQSGLVEELRSIKDADEIAEIRAAVRQAERGFELMCSLLLKGQTEREAAHELEHGMRRFGALRAAFEPIVAVGDRAALPHYRAGPRRFDESGFALIDWGAVSEQGYHSDLTRLIVTSKLPPKLHHVYGVVLKAQQAGIAAIRPGVRCQDVDAAARNVIEEAGYAKYFGHGLGHGIGLDIHELPRLSPISTDELKPGMIVTVEPGIYLPGVGGVRIEDDILVTRDGAEVLSSLPNDVPIINNLLP
jgi:Xaa-Pro aminopeptidase